MKEKVTKFDLSAAFKALDEIGMPKANKGIKANRINLKETLRPRSKTDLLMEDYYDVNDQNDLEQAQAERKAEVAKAKLARIEKIVDLDAESEEDLLPSYVGKVIIECPQCMTLFYKNPEDIEPSEEDESIVNVNEVCQHCGNTSGYTVIGKVGKISEDEVDNYEDAESDLEATEVENNTEEEQEEIPSEANENSSAEESEENTDDFDLDLAPIDETEETEEADENAEKEEPAEDEEKKEENFKVKTGAALTEADTLEEAPVSDLRPEFDSRKSFYGKAQIDDRADGSKVLYSYNTPVVGIKDGKATLLNSGSKGWDSSVTTLRHVKDFLRQYNFEVGSHKDLAKTYPEMEYDEWNKLNENLTESAKIYIDLTDYQPWSGAIEYWNKIMDSNKLDELDSYLEEMYPDGLTDTELNDILWFEGDGVLEYLGIGNNEESEFVEESFKETLQESKEASGNDAAYKKVLKKALTKLTKKDVFAVVVGYNQGKGMRYLDEPLIKKSAEELRDFEAGFRRGKEGTKVVVRAVYPKDIEGIKEYLGIKTDVKEALTENTENNTKYIVEKGVNKGLIVSKDSICVGDEIELETNDLDYETEFYDEGGAVIPDNLPMDAPISYSSPEKYYGRITNWSWYHDLTPFDIYWYLEETSIKYTQEEIDSTDDDLAEKLYNDLISNKKFMSILAAEHSDEAEAEIINLEEHGKLDSDYCSSLDSVDDYYESLQKKTKTITEDISNDDFADLLQSDEFKKPISHEEAKAYIAQEKIDNIADDLKTNSYESISMPELNKKLENVTDLNEKLLGVFIKEALVKGNKNIKSFKIKSCSMFDESLAIKGIATDNTNKNTIITFTFNKAQLKEGKVKLLGTSSLAGNNKFGVCFKLSENCLTPKNFKYKYNVNNTLVEGLIKRR